MPNILEKLAGSVGRIQGAYRTALKSVNMSLTDPRAWTNIGGIGELGGRKPTTKAAGIEQFVSWVYICATLNAQALSSVPLELYVSSAETGKKWRTIKTKGPVDKITTKWLMAHSGLRPYIRKAEEVEAVVEHPFIDLMKNVNPFMNESDLKELTSLYLDLTGEAYWYVLKGALGQPVELWPIPSTYIKPIPGKALKEWIAGYEYQRGAKSEILSVDEVIYFSCPNPANQFQGMSVVRGICDAVYVNSKINDYVESIFENKARPGGIFTSESGMSSPEHKRATEELKEKYAGAGKAGKSMLLPPGIQFLPDSLSPDEMAYIEGKKITREEIAAAFNTPISLWDQSAIRANVEGAQYFHARYGLLPRLRKIEEKLNEKLLPMFDDTGRLFCAFENPVPEDRAYVLAKRTADLNGGVSTINEERSEDGKEPIDGGDEPLVSSLLVPLSQAVAEPEPIPPQLVPGLNPEGDETNPNKPKPKPNPKPGEDEGDEGTDNADADAEKLATLTLQKLREKLGVAK
jgi:HK97 family phage portal protein